MAFDYIPGNTWIHRLDPRVKIIMYVVFSIFIIGYSDPTILALLVVCMLIIIKSAKVPFDRFTPILKAITPILILYAVFNLIGYHAPWTPTLLCYLFGHPIYVETIVYIVGMQLRFIGFALLIRLILLVTPIKDLISALTRWKLPPEFALAMGAAVSYLPVLLRETQTTMEAQAARGVEYKTRNPVRALKRYIPVIIPSLLNSLRRAQQIAIAVELRGFTYNPAKRTERKQLKYTALDYMVLGILAVVGVVGFLGSVWIFDWGNYRFTLHLIGWIYKTVSEIISSIF
nr:energy-coupling factor transporter transmembrane component T [Candidatus Baldrarchaeota archaeon]